MSDQNWRTDVDAGDYFLHQKKQLQVADRRPVIRRASDLVGPGIAQDAVRLADFNDTLATFNGFYSALNGASNAPVSGPNWIGFVSGDAEIGGVQMFYRMDTGVAYRRLFTRNPADPTVLTWGSWSTV